MKRNKRRFEFKKIGFLAVVLFSLCFIAVGRVAEWRGITIDTSVDVNLVLTVLGAYVAYCVASTAEKRSANKYGISLSDKRDNDSPDTGGKE